MFPKGHYPKVWSLLLIKDSQMNLLYTIGDSIYIHSSRDKLLPKSVTVNPKPQVVFEWVNHSAK